MFKWLRGKINKKINHEMNGCIIQNLNFVTMIREEQYLIKYKVLSCCLFIIIFYIILVIDWLVGI